MVNGSSKQQGQGLVAAIGNGGTIAAFYRLSVWVFCTVIAVAGFFASRTLDRIEQNQIEFQSQISQLQVSTSVNTNAIDLLSEMSKDRYTKTQAEADWATQLRRDIAQDKALDRLEDRITKPQ